MSRPRPKAGLQTPHDAPTPLAPDAPDISAPKVQEFLLADGVGKSIRAYKKDQNIFIQGEIAHGVFYIQRGKVKLSATSEQGKNAVVGILTERQFFGERCLASHAARAMTATAMEDCVLTSIDKTIMRAALRDDLAFSDAFLTYLLTRNIRIEDDLIDLLFNSSEKRLARLLLLLANFGQEGRSPITDVNLSQDTLAKIIGTTRSRVSFFMNRFRRSGYVSYVSFSSTIKVHSSLLDAVLHEKRASRQDG
jgi:CRP/FNR family transcriptional regulator, cyclic AMP receptor protein